MCRCQVFFIKIEKRKQKNWNEHNFNTQGKKLKNWYIFWSTGLELCLNKKLKKCNNKN